MSAIGWTRLAMEYCERVLGELRRVEYRTHLSEIGSEVLELSEGLLEAGCCAMKIVRQAKGNQLEVVIVVVRAASGSMIEDGFSITKTGRIRPMFSDGYED